MTCGLTHHYDMEHKENWNRVLDFKFSRASTLCGPDQVPLKKQFCRLSMKQYYPGFKAGPDGPRCFKMVQYWSVWIPEHYCSKDGLRWFLIVQDGLLLCKRLLAHYSNSVTSVPVLSKNLIGCSGLYVHVTRVSTKNSVYPKHSQEIHMDKESLQVHRNILISQNNRQLLANITSLIAALESQKITILATKLFPHT